MTRADLLSEKARQLGPIGTMVKKLIYRRTPGSDEPDGPLAHASIMDVTEYGRVQRCVRSVMQRVSADPSKARLYIAQPFLAIIAQSIFWRLGLNASCTWNLIPKVRPRTFIKMKLKSKRRHPVGCRSSRSLVSPHTDIATFFKKHGSEKMMTAKRSVGSLMGKEQ